MDIRFQQHLMEVQIKEMVMYIERLENNNTIMMNFINSYGLGTEFEKFTAPVPAPKEGEIPQQVSEPLEQ